MTPPPDGNGNDNGAGTTLDDVVGSITNIRSNVQISALEPFLSVTYALTGVPSGATVSAYYVLVDSLSPDAQPIGTRVILATGLLSGPMQAFSFDPATTGTGIFRLGIVVVLGAGEKTFESQGLIQVQGPPAPVFIQPVDLLTEVVRGESVFVSFDAGDPENRVAWRLFLLDETDSLNVAPDQLGTQLAVGQGNIGSFLVQTADLTAGEYELGLSATDSGESIAATVARGDAEVIVTIPNSLSPPAERRRIQVNEPGTATPPTISFSAPGTSNVELFGNQAFTIRFQITAEAGANGTVDVFLDEDRSISNGFLQVIEAELEFSTTSVQLPVNLAEGTYFVGATMRQESLAPVTAYAGGSIQIVRTPTLVVTAPDTPLPIRPSVPGETPVEVTVSWTTNVPATAGQVDVFARNVDLDGDPFGPEIQLLEPSSTSITTTRFSSTSSGVFEVYVRVTLNDTSIDVTGLCVDGVCERVAPQPVRVTSVPGVLWLGSLAKAEPEFEGAIFQGIQNEDNAGSTLSSAGDLNDDGLGDFVIGARYGKPFFVNPSGIGPGEAYLVYGAGGANRLEGQFNLNSLGTSLLRGVLLTGIRTVGDSDDTDGLSDITRIPDADADGNSELVFGFPRTNSAGGTQGPLERAGQFLNGGVVILSSDNSALRNPAVGTPRINLQAVGQRFSSMTVQNNDINLVAADRRRFQAGDPNANPPTPNTCVNGTDGILDTIVGPGEGFIPILATSAAELLGFTIIPANTPPAEGVCPTQFDVPTCSGPSGMVLGGTTPGSGFYPDGAVPAEPRGARIIGPGANEGFGTSVTSSNALGTVDPGDLIISAPNRNAMPEFVDGISSTINGAGVAFLLGNERLWGADVSLPTPFQYLAGIAGHCGDGRGTGLGALRIAGDDNDRIQNILGIEDFNRDGRNDVAIGAPRAGNGQGRVYIAFRREEAVEGDFVLNKLELAPTDAERLAGVLITSTSLDGLGSSLATGVDFNGDGIADLVVGSPNASNGVGEVIVLFSDPTLQTPAGGTSVQTLLASRTPTGGARAARIRGNPLDTNGRFGFNVANAGDLDGDGLDELLIAAPGATPRFDPDPTDAIDELTETGIDLETPFGEQDDVTGPLGQPDGKVDSFDDLSSAGIVYVIFGDNRLDEFRTCTGTEIACNDDADCDAEADQTCANSSTMTININQLGKSQLEGFMLVGRRGGDRIGGGDAGDATQGGLSAKAGRGRSDGLSTAGDVDGDGKADFLIGSVLADPRRDPNSGVGATNAGEAYLIYGSVTSSIRP